MQIPGGWLNIATTHIGRQILTSVLDCTQPRPITVSEHMLIQLEQHENIMPLLYCYRDYVMEQGFKRELNEDCHCLSVQKFGMDVVSILHAHHVYGLHQHIPLPYIAILKAAHKFLKNEC